ncbi:MAG TPA: hypothetical protein VGO47_12825 [Chlamydiales bacterium]|nr:hypothetical protein [Chlamydiales bacterium]
MSVSSTYYDCCRISYTPPLPHLSSHNLSPTASSASASSATATSSSASNSTLHPNPGFPPFRRRSVDTGGLNLVVNDHTGSGSGRGYGGWVEKDGVETPATNVAELVMAWKEKSDRMIDDAHPPITPPQC